MSLDLVPIWTLILAVAVFMTRWNKGARLGTEGSQPFLGPPCKSPESVHFG